MFRGLLWIGFSLLISPFVNAAEEQAAEKPAGEPNAELRAFAQQLVKIVETQDRQALADSIDWEYVLGNSPFSKCGFETPTVKLNFAIGFLRASRDIEKPFYTKFLPVTDVAALLQIKKITEQESLVVVRYFSEDASMYLAFRVAADTNKSYKVIDISYGSFVSSFTSGLEFAVLAMHKQQFIKNLGPYEPFRPWLDKNQDLFADFTKACNEEDADGVIKLYPEILPAIQRLELIEFHYYRANASTEKPVLKLEEMRAYYDKHRDPGTLQLVLAYCQSQGDLDSLLATYDEFDQLLGKDPLNNIHRANVYTDQGKFPEAYECARQLIKDYPEWKRSHITLMVVSLYDKNYKLTLKQLQFLRDKFELDLGELVDTDDDYKDFRKSPEYAVWKKENDAAAAKQD